VQNVRNILVQNITLLSILDVIQILNMNVN